jgi:hypothetical protein
VVVTSRYSEVFIVAVVPVYADVIGAMACPTVPT